MLVVRGMELKRYERVAERVRQMFRSGALHDGERIPSVRAMARQMRVSITTVVEAYRLLERRGVIESRPQSGFFVRPRSLHDVAPTAAPAPAETEPIGLFTERVRIAPWFDALLRAGSRQDVLPLGAGMPAPEFFPSAELAASMRRVLRRRPFEVNQYCLPPGHIRLRTEVARHLLEAGCTVDPDEIHITAGASHALLLGLRAVTERGDIVAVESPGYFGFYGLLHFLGLRALEIPTHPAHGLSVEALARVLERGTKLGCVLLSSSFSNPTGAMMPEDARRELAELCVRHRVPVLEDDTYGDLAFAPPRPRPVKAFAPAAVMHAGSFSKILAPGYRVGWLAAGRHHRDVGRCNMLSWVSLGLPIQLAMAEFLSDGGMQRHLRRLRGRYRDNVALLQNAVRESFPPDSRISEPRGGHFVWVRLPGERDARHLATAALAHGISIAPGVLFSSRCLYADYLRLNCAYPWSRRVRSGIQTLGALASAMEPARRRRPARKL